MLEWTLHPNLILAGDDCDPQTSIWFSYFSESQTFFHTQIFATMAYFDLTVDGDGDIRPAATLHMTKALSLLRKDLAIVDRATTGATIAIVTVFAMFAFVFGDIPAAKNHLHGLFKLVTMRGGLHSLGAHSHLQTKCCRSVPLLTSIFIPLIPL